MKPAPLSTDPPTPRFWSVVRKSALLNLGIVLTALPVLAAAAGPKGIVPTLLVLAAVSVVLWSATFATFSFASLWRLYFGPATDPLALAKPISKPAGPGVADHWVDDSL